MYDPSDPRITGHSLSAGLGGVPNGGGGIGSSDVDGRISVPSFPAESLEGVEDSGWQDRAAEDRFDGSNVGAESSPSIGERFDPDASIELEAVMETREILGDFLVAGGKQHSRKQQPQSTQQQQSRQWDASPASFEAATALASDRVDAEMQRVEKLLDAKTRDTLGAMRVRARMRPGPAVALEARLQRQEHEQQHLIGKEAVPYRDALAALTLNDHGSGDIADIDEEDGPKLKVKVLARHCITSWCQQQNTPKKWGCHTVRCTLPRTVGKRGSDILRHVTNNIGCLVAIDENGGRLNIKDEDHALYQSDGAHPLQGDDICASSFMVHHCSVSQEIEDGSADKQGSVDLSYRELDEMPLALLGNPKETSPAVLNLSQNNLTSIPSRFFLDRERSRLRNLHSLLLSDNKLRLVPPGLDELVGLKVLSLSNNMLTELPWQIGKLVNLTSLFLAHNQLSNLPWETRNLTSLEELQIGSNELSRFPSRVLGIPGLKRLGLQRNRITSIPGTICGDGDLSRLESLDLTSNRITHLPPGLGSLPSLARLFLASNLIRRVPEAWAPLRKSLKVIFLGGNERISLPDWIGEVPLHG